MKLAIKMFFSFRVPKPYRPRFRYPAKLPDEMCKGVMAGRPSIHIAMHEALHAVACVRHQIKVVHLHASKDRGYCCINWPTEQARRCRNDIRISMLPKMYAEGQHARIARSQNFSEDVRQGFDMAYKISSKPHRLVDDVEREMLMLGRKRVVRQAAFALAKVIRAKRIVGGREATRIIKGVLRR